MFIIVIHVTLNKNSKLCAFLTSFSYSNVQSISSWSVTTSTVSLVINYNVNYWCRTLKNWCHVELEMMMIFLLDESSKQLSELHNILYIFKISYRRSNVTLIVSSEVFLVSKFKPIGLSLDFMTTICSMKLLASWWKFWATMRVPSLFDTF